MIKLIYPLRVRLWAFYRFGSDFTPQGPYPLHFAPGVSLHEIVSTDLVGRSIAFTGFYELELSRELARLSRRGGLLVDVGANIGYFTHLWLAGNAGNHVIAFEASPRVYSILKRNISVYKTWEGRVSMHSLAASDKSGSIRFDLGPPEQTGWGGMVESGISDSVIEVNAVRLDEIIPRDIEVAYLKIDVEGADPLVIQGAEGLLRRKQVRAGIFEINPDRMAKLGLTAAPAVALLKDCGYSVEVRDDGCRFSLL